MTIDQVKGALYGVAIGDALGVPVEFNQRAYLDQNPVVDFIGYKSHNQPPGTFSDDASLTFCLAESLCYGFDLIDMADRFVRWQSAGYWAAYGEVFDIGMTTYAAISRLKRGVQPQLAGDFDEDANGNGSLMRIMPLVFYTKDLPLGIRYEIVKDVSSITHGHIRSVISCFYYLELALHLLNGKSKEEAYKITATTVKEVLDQQKIIERELKIFDPLLETDISLRTRDKISSSGYVIDSLMASVWCFMTTNNYQEATLKSVNLGHDTDTTGAITGGLAGLYYGLHDIPEKWRRELARTKDIDELGLRLFNMRQ
ncbi:MAG: ADP-ribosylglycohydrolase family protein [Pseudobacter sp.]|uniref:ADP-ribosylglycohydrolase family protein n=1 Tax=Pseudobacter sp. TaxID=2045420 RepID=UPI003F80A323